MLDGTTCCPSVMVSFLESIGTSEYLTIPKHLKEVKHIN